MKNIIVIVCASLALAACGDKLPQTPQTVEVKTIEVKKPAPIIPKSDRVSMKPVQWHVLTEQTKDKKFQERPVYFGLSEEDYKALSINISSLRAHSEQQKAAIDAYERYFQK